MSEILANLSKNGNGKLIEATYPTTSIPNGTYTTIGSISLKANHTYIITASHQYSTSIANVDIVARLNMSGNKAVFRNSDGMYNGGGVALATIIRPTSDSTMTFDAWQGSGSTQTVSSVNMNAYQLD